MSPPSGLALIFPTHQTNFHSPSDYADPKIHLTGQQHDRSHQKRDWFVIAEAGRAVDRYLRMRSAQRSELTRAAIREWLAQLADIHEA